MLDASLIFLVYCFRYRALAAGGYKHVKVVGHVQCTKLQNEYFCLNFNQLDRYFIYRGICSNQTNDPVKERLEPYFKPLAAAYKQICFEQEKKKRAFFGLRDFYR